MIYATKTAIALASEEDHPPAHRPRQHVPPACEFTDDPIVDRFGPRTFDSEAKLMNDERPEKLKKATSAQ